MLNFRIGYGYDVHQLVEGRDLWLGGIKIDHYKGAIGHSDSDVLIHAIIDALLGAANLGDIGLHFPDTDPKYKDIDSKKLLLHSMQLLREHKYEIGNIDSTVCLEKPKLKPHLEAMKKTLSEVMAIDHSAISIKATTSEKMGFVGDESGITASAVALIYRIYENPAPGDNPELLA